MELSRRLQEIAKQMRAAADSIQSLIDELSGVKSVSEEALTAVEGQLKTELGENLQHVDVLSSRDIRIKPKKFLDSDIFRSVADVARKHGGRWDGMQRCFIIYPQTKRT